jgi:carbon-monoxide dehydrogenase large subunit
MGIGGVLREQVAHDASGQNLTGSFMDYALTSAADLPPIQILSLHSPSRHTRTGSKAMSEGGVMGPSALSAARLPTPWLPSGWWWSSSR